jgi:hypothetical protein
MRLSITFATEPPPANNSVTIVLKITNRGPRIFTGEQLVSKGYPKEASSDDIYAVFYVEPQFILLELGMGFRSLGEQEEGAFFGATFHSKSC